MFKWALRSNRSDWLTGKQRDDKLAKAAIRQNEKLWNGSEAPSAREEIVK